VILVHGAFADSSSWNGVIADLTDRGFPVIAAANPLRGLSTDAATVRALVQSVDGAVVLVGHSYGGAVISNAAVDLPNVKALVYIAGFIPEHGESALELSNKFPGSTLGETLQTVVLPDGNTDFYVRQDLFRNQFAADVPAAQAGLMAATQRPVTEAALTEASAVPAWHDVPVWSLIPTGDKNIPPPPSTSWPSAPTRRSSRSPTPPTPSSSPTPTPPPTEPPASHAQRHTECRFPAERIPEAPSCRRATIGGGLRCRRLGRRRRGGAACGACLVCRGSSGQRGPAA
jgi:pimeloyl-ACP methyl ester carboxylesterase